MRLQTHDVINAQRAKRMIEEKLPVVMLDSLPPVNDALTPDEIERAIAACENLKERLILVLLGRLAMRVGAIVHLRLAGVIENINQLSPDMERWVISKQISSTDKTSRGKARQVNSWSLEKFPIVWETLDEYINVYWRPRYEKWYRQGDGAPMLTEGWVFPPNADRTIQLESGRSITFITEIIKRVLKRIGVVGHRAHPHAFRKGVATELMRTGNPLKTVSVFLHHKSTAVTEQAYDKRSNEELLDKMVLPIGWEKVVLDATGTEEDQGDGTKDGATSSTMGSAQIRMMTAAMGLMERMNHTKKKMEIMMSLLTPEMVEQYEALCLEQGLDPKAE